MVYKKANVIQVQVQSCQWIPCRSLSEEPNHMAFQVGILPLTSTASRQLSPQVAAALLSKVRAELTSRAQIRLLPEPAFSDP